jgi:hypothetical protein
VILLALALGADPGGAQWAVGVRVGADYATVNYGEPKPFQVEASAGSHLGALLSYGLSDRVELQLELARSVRGFGIGGSGFDGTVQMTYLEAPVMAVLSLPTGGFLVPHLALGGVISREVSCSFDLLVGGAPTSRDCDAPEHQFEDRRRTDLSVRVGGGVGTRLGKWTTFADILYDFGLRDLDDGGGDRETAHSRAWMFSMGARYAIRAP